MKKVLGVLILILAVLGVGGGLAWLNRSSVVAKILQSHLGVPVYLSSLDLTTTNAVFNQLIIGNPPRFHSPSAFSARVIGVISTIPQIRGNPLIIDEIDMSDLLITIEKSPNKDTTNWKEILKQKSKPSDRHYLIRTLTLRNLTVQVVNADGSRKKYPTLDYMEFHNISDETGFPISEIEKAIFNRIIQDVFQKFDDIQKMFNPFIPNPIPRTGLPFFK